MTVDLRNRLQHQLGTQVQLHPTVLFDYPTIHRITDHIANLLKLKPVKDKPVVIEARQGIKEPIAIRSEEHTSELQSLMRISYAVFCLKKKNDKHRNTK